MIRRLRRKFIIVAMCSVLAVLAVIVCAMNVASYVSMVSRADDILEMLAENEGHFPDNFREKEPLPGREYKDFASPVRKTSFSAETPYDTRFFSVKLDEDGEAISVDTGRIAAVKTDTAIEYAKLVRDRGKTKGFLDHYRYIYQWEEGESCARVIFVDCGKELDSFHKLLLTGAEVSAVGVIAVFVLVWFFSKRVFAPVQESYAKQKRFITDASHELKTPLTIISANVDLLEMEGEENQWTGSIRNQVRRLRDLTEQMVTLSRLEEEQKVIMTKCDLSRIVSEAADSFVPAAKAAGKELRTDIEEGFSCMAEEDKLRQLVSLLLDNALKYAAEHGEIRVKLAHGKKAGKVRLTVWNTVSEESGIEAGDQSVLFERFYRTDSSRNSKTGGSGIGLSVVKAIVERYGGKITAKSEDGRSIEFRAELPGR